MLKDSSTSHHPTGQQVSNRPRKLLPPGAAPQAVAGGTVVALAGVLIGGGAWYLVPVEHGVAGVFLLLEKILLTAFGLAFVALGLAVGWSSVGAEVDRESGELLLIHTAVVWRRVRRVPLARIRKIRVVGGDDPSGRGPGWIEVHGGEGFQKLIFGFGQSVRRLRSLAVWIRDWSGLSADVFSGLAPGEPVRVLAPERSEIRRALERLEGSPRVTVAFRDGAWIVELPPMGFRGYALGMLAAAAGSAGLVAVFFVQMRRAQAAGPGAMAPLFFLVIPVALLLAGLSLARRSVRLTVDAGGLAVERRGLFGSRRTMVPAHEVEGIEVLLSGGNRARSWQLAVLGPARKMLFTIEHPALYRRRAELEALAVILRDGLAPSS